MNRRIATFLAGAGLCAGLGVATTAVGAGEAAAAPLITCAGSICTNHGDTIGIGFGNYTCPNGIVYPSIAIVLPHSSAPVYPATCTPAAPGLY